MTMYLGMCLSCLAWIPLAWIGTVKWEVPKVTEPEKKLASDRSAGKCFENSRVTDSSVAFSNLVSWLLHHQTSFRLLFAAIYCCRLRNGFCMRSKIMTGRGCGIWCTTRRAEVSFYTFSFFHVFSNVFEFVILKWRIALWRSFWNGRVTDVSGEPKWRISFRLFRVLVDSNVLQDCFTCRVVLTSTCCMPGAKANGFFPPPTQREARGRNSGCWTFRPIEKRP